MKPASGWAIVTPSGMILVGYVRMTRSKAIKDWSHESFPWKKWYRRGYRCVRVDIVTKEKVTK